ncbi:MAG: hypothetical protein V4492_09230 [Chlamydiota bacterium]
MTFTFNHHGCFLEGRPFCPVFSGREKNVSVITLSASLSDDLNWDPAIQSAYACAAEDHYILWELDLGLSHTCISPQDSAAFFSHSLAVEEFAKKIFPSFKDKTLAVCMYRGGVNVERTMPIHLWEERFQEWMHSYVSNVPDWHQLHKASQFEASGHYYRLFCMQILSEYLHRLVSFLPDDVMPLICVDVSREPSTAAILQLLSRERFEHLMAVPLIGDVPVFPSGNEPVIGACLPVDSHIDASVLLRLDQLYSELECGEMPFRIVAEAKLTEEWDGLDEIHVIAQAVSAQGTRKLRGFSIAGGVIKSS